MLCSLCLSLLSVCKCSVGDPSRTPSPHPHVLTQPMPLHQGGALPCGDPHCPLPDGEGWVCRAFVQWERALGLEIGKIVIFSAANTAEK